MVRKRFTNLCAGLSFSLLMACSGQTGEIKSYNEGINIIPMPQSLTIQEGAFKLGSGTGISATTPEAKTVAEFFATKMLELQDMIFLWVKAER